VQWIISWKSRDDSSASQGYFSSSRISSRQTHKRRILWNRLVYEDIAALPPTNHSSSIGSFPANRQIESHFSASCQEMPRVPSLTASKSPQRVHSPCSKWSPAPRTPLPLENRMKLFSETTTTSWQKTAYRSRGCAAASRIASTDIDISCYGTA